MVSPDSIATSPLKLITNITEWTALHSGLLQNYFALALVQSGLKHCVSIYISEVIKEQFERHKMKICLTRSIVTIIIYVLQK